jgi:hypothetical protein
MRGSQTRGNTICNNIQVQLLMRQAAVHSKETQTEPLVKGLGIRINKITILNEKDCIKLKPRQWLDLKMWREINDIVRVQGL